MENGSRHGRGFTLWFTGLSGAGKTTIAEIVEKELRARHGKIEVLDGDIIAPTCLRASASLETTGTPTSCASAS